MINGRDLHTQVQAPQACIFDIQRFSIHDGPGIRTTIFFKGCPLRCRWCQNPESHKQNMEVAFYRERCAGCLECREVCPEQAILESEEMRVDFQKCSACARCVSVCPHQALRMVGAWWNAGALSEEVLKDKDFFVDSNGGITLSGGEPAIYGEFLRAFLPLMKEKGIHVNMETCGMFLWDEVARILPFLDLVYYDLKLMDSGMHKTYTGRNNKTIVENFVRLAKTFPNLEARMPVIPTINDAHENVIDVAQFLKDNHQKSIHLLPYHRLGEAKLQRIRTELRPLNLPESSSGSLEAVKALFEEQGILPVLQDSE